MRARPLPRQPRGRRPSRGQRPVWVLRLTPQPLGETGKLLDFVKLTIVGGLVVILPMAAAILLSIKMLGAVQGAVDPVAAQLPFARLAGRAIAVVLILAGCFVTGLPSRPHWRARCA